VPCCVIASNGYICKLYICNYKQTMGVHGSAVGSGTALQAGRSRVRFPMVSLEFFINIILPASLCPWGWLSLQQKWVPGIFPGCKGGRCVGLTTLPPSCADCLDIWESQPPGTSRPCPGLWWVCFLQTRRYRRWGIPLFVISTRTALEPAHNDRVPFPKKKSLNTPALYYHTTL